MMKRVLRFGMRFLDRPLAAGLALGLAMSCAVPARAQLADVHGAVRITAGTAMKYLDEPWEFAGGGSLRVYLARRLSVEPEITVSPGSRFKQWTFVPNIAFDLRHPGERLTPYVIGGIGYFHEIDKSISYKRSEMAWNGGVGLRARLTRRIFLSPEFRIGHLTRATISLGCLF